MSNDLIPRTDELNRLKDFLENFKRPTGWITERQDIEWKAKWMAYEKTHKQDNYERTKAFWDWAGVPPVRPIEIP